jgi:hypothetical protein
MVRLQQNIIRLDVTMQNAVIVSMLNGIGQASNDSSRLLYRRTLTLQEIAETFAIDELRNLIRNSVNIARLQDPHNAGMIEHRGRSTFS